MTSAQPYVEGPTSLRSRFLQLIANLAAVGMVVVVGFTLGGFAARWWWRFELACHFRVQYFWLLALASIVLWAARRRWLAVVGAITACVNFMTIMPIYWPVPGESTGETELRLVSFNVRYENLEHEQVLTFLHAQPADFLLLMEVSDGWAHVVEGLYDLYPHRHVALRDDHRGIALLSRIPWREVQTVGLGHAAVPAVVARFEIDQQPVVLVGTHPSTPDTRQWAILRNEELEEIAKLVRAEKNAVIVVGDLNTTSFSPYFRDLLATTGLRDSRQGRGNQATWGPAPFLEIAIDHCLVSPEITVLQRRVGPHLGSDHRPIFVDLQLRNATGGTATKSIN